MLFGNHGFLLAHRVVFDDAAVLRGNGVDVLTVAERVPVGAEAGLQVDWRLRHAGADDEPQVRLVEFLEVGRGQHPGIGHDDHVGDLVPVLELLDDRDHRQGLYFVASKQPISSRKSLTQSDGCG